MLRESGRVGEGAPRPGFSRIMLDGAEDLYAIAEFAIGLAGFAAIALVLGRRDSALAVVLGRRSGGLDPANAFAVRSMIVSAVGPGFLAFVPILLFRLGAAPEEVWPLASGTFVATTVVFALPIARLQWRNHQEVVEDGNSAILSIGLWALMVAALLANLANAFGVPFASSVGPYLLGLWLTLAVSGMLFVTMVFGILR
jgi:hypothetical protein